MASAIDAGTIDSPGLVVVDSGGEIVAVTARRTGVVCRTRSRHEVPVPPSRPRSRPSRRCYVARPAARPTPRLRVHTNAGRWVVLHASFLNGTAASAEQIAVIIEAATPTEVAAVIMRAYGLTERERSVTGLVCQGRSTAEIAAALWISGNTVQDHLKSVFDKTGVRSRRELISAILRDHYLPALGQARRVSSTGFFQ